MGIDALRISLRKGVMSSPGATPPMEPEVGLEPTTCASRKHARFNHCLPTLAASRVDLRQHC